MKRAPSRSAALSLFERADTGHVLTAGGRQALVEAHKQVLGCAVPAHAETPRNEPNNRECPTGVKADTSKSEARLAELAAMSDLRLADLFKSFCPRMTMWRWWSLRPSELLVAVTEGDPGAKERLAGVVHGLEREMVGS